MIPVRRKSRRFGRSKHSFFVISLSLRLMCNRALRARAEPIEPKSRRDGEWGLFESGPTCALKLRNDGGPKLRCGIGALRFHGLLSCEFEIEVVVGAAWVRDLNYEIRIVLVLFRVVVQVVETVRANVFL